MVIYSAKVTNFSISRLSLYNQCNLIAAAARFRNPKLLTIHSNLIRSNIIHTCLATTAAGLLTAAVICLVPLQSIAIQQQQPQELTDSDSTLSNVPQNLSSDDGEIGNKRTSRIQRPKSRMAELCTGKCVGTCVRGGYGAPGEGPLNVRSRPLVVFKDGFRSRHYCLVECSDICNLIRDGEDGP